MTATVSEATHFDSRAPDVWHRAAADRDGARVGHGRRGVRWRWRTAVADSVELLAVVWSIPLAMLVVGAPVVLTIALLLWLGRLALGLF